MLPAVNEALLACANRRPTALQSSDADDRLLDKRQTLVEDYFPLFEILIDVDRVAPVRQLSCRFPNSSL